MSLRRAASAAYYAMFHCLAYECANSLIGGNSAARSDHAWRQVYRALEHKYASNQCKDKEISKFPKEIADFANHFVSMQEKRHDADYDPFRKLLKSEVTADIDLTYLHLTAFASTPKSDRRAFCAFVLFKKRGS